MNFISYANFEIVSHFHCPLCSQLVSHDKYAAIFIECFRTCLEQLDLVKRDLGQPFLDFVVAIRKGKATGAVVR